jgi:hypothetical protein
VTHRLFWLAVGAGLGISGYRRAHRAVRELTRPVAHRPRLRFLGRKDALRPKVAGLAEFARDVRDGMDLYEEQQRLNIERRRATNGPTLDVQQGSDAGNGSLAPRAHRARR